MQAEHFGDFHIADCRDDDIRPGRGLQRVWTRRRGGSDCVALGRAVRERIADGGSSVVRAIIELRDEVGGQERQEPIENLHFLIFTRDVEQDAGRDIELEVILDRRDVSRSDGDADVT